MVMYSTANGYPVAEMPFRVRRSNGLTYTSEAVYEHVNDPTHPWIAVSDPPDYDAATHTLSWSGVDWVVTENPPIVIVEEPVEEPVEVVAAEETTETVADATAPAEVVAVDAADTIDGDANG